MRVLVSVFTGLAALATLQAEPTPSQIVARRTPTKEFSKLLASAAKQDGEPGLSIMELETVLGEKDEIKETEILTNSLKRIYHLSNGRRLHVSTLRDAVNLAAVVDGTKVELVWK